MKTRSRLAVLVTGMCLAGAAAVIPANAASPMSSGGGCTDAGPFQVCISASGGQITSTVEFWGYSGCTSVRQYITDLTISNSFGYALSCNPADYAGKTINGTNGHYYRTSATVWYSGGSFTAYSPELYFSN
jgi:hypothetical protein